MKSFFKKVPSYILLLILTVVYLFCGFLVGYQMGYKDGQTAYMNYINKIFSTEK